MRSEMLTVKSSVALRVRIRFTASPLSSPILTSWALLEHTIWRGQSLASSPPLGSLLRSLGLSRPVARGEALALGIARGIDEPG